MFHNTRCTSCSLRTAMLSPPTGRSAPHQPENNQCAPFGLCTVCTRFADAGPMCCTDRILLQAVAAAATKAETTESAAVLATTTVIFWPDSAAPTQTPNGWPEFPRALWTAQADGAHLRASFSVVAHAENCPQTGRTGREPLTPDRGRCGSDGRVSHVRTCTSPASSSMFRCG